MKNYLIVSMLVLSGLSFADSLELIKVGHQAHPVNVKSVSTEIVGEHGFPSTQVFVTATFSNSCVAPKSEELVSIVQFGDKSYDTLNISLGMESNRVCPMIYKPVTVVINVGQYVRPNDGLFSKVIVNGKIAQ